MRCHHIQVLTFRLLILALVFLLKHYTLKRGPPKPAPGDVEGLAAEPTMTKTNEKDNETSPSPTIHDEKETLRELGKIEKTVAGDVALS